MSRSDKTLNAGDRTPNPAKRFFEWSGSKGTLSYWDKEAKEKVAVPLPFTFLVLDQLNTVTGYDNDTQTGYYSPEVRRTTDTFEIRRQGEKRPVLTGAWNEIKESLPPGAKFAKSVYVGYYDENRTLQLGHLKLSGAGLGKLSEKAIQQNMADAKKKKAELFEDDYLKRIGWFEFLRTCPGDIEEIAVCLEKGEWDKNGAVEFYRPVFRRIENVSPETMDAALELDIELQKYLAEYLDRKGETVDTVDAIDEPHRDNVDEYNENLNREVKAKSVGSQDGPFNWDAPVPDELDEIPF